MSPSSATVRYQSVATAAKPIDSRYEPASLCRCGPFVAACVVGIRHLRCLACALLTVESGLETGCREGLRAQPPSRDRPAPHCWLQRSQSPPTYCAIFEVRLTEPETCGTGAKSCWIVHAGEDANVEVAVSFPVEVR